ATCTSTVTVQDVTAPEVFCVGGFGIFTESEDFEAGLPAGWSTVVNTGTCDWINSGDMPTGDDFPTLAMLFDDDDCGLGAPASNVSLLSAVYDLTGASNVSLGYDVAFQESGIQTFTVEVFDGAAWQQIALYEDDLDPDIQTESFDVSAFANDAFQVRWTFDDNNGEWGWGAGVDNFLLTYEAASGGGLDVFLDASGVATVDPNDLVTGVNEACGYTITAGGAGGGTMASITTVFDTNNGLGANATVFYNITVGANDIEITDLDVNTDATGAFNLSMYTLVGTYVGNETNAAAWGSPVSTGTGTGMGANNPSNAVLATPVTLSANTTYGVAINMDVDVNYSGTGSNPAPGALMYSNADVTLNLGSAVSGLFTGTAFSPRIWNGTIHYTVNNGSGLEFTCADLGENIVEVTVTDDSGNSSTCMAVVNVIDNIAPVLVCQDATIELGPDGTAVVDPMALLASSPTTYEVMVIGSDNQSGNEGFTDFTVNVTEAANITFDWDYTSNDTPGFDSFGYLLNGTYTQLTDPAQGNQSGSSAVAVAPGDVFGFRSQTDDNVFGNNETVISNFMPGFNGQFDPANWTLTLTDSDGTAFFTEIPGGPLSFDACGITVLAVDVPMVTCADIGTPITVTVFASDASGNLASCTSIVTVVDLLAPEITCPADQTVDPGPGNIFYIVPDYVATGEATIEDNCTDPVTVYTQDPAPGTAIPDGVYTVTFTATDEYGNTSTCDFELTVESVLGVSQNSLDAGLALYPNPASNVVNLVNKTNISLEKMMIYDINGKLVNQTDLRTMQGERAVDVSSLAAGVYVVQIIGDNASTVKRLIKE
ncbi:MAG: subtilisin, partial [Aequorivita sp.]|nr:subtilisin [Aequorivita sp.]